MKKAPVDRRRSAALLRLQCCITTASLHSSCRLSLCFSNKSRVMNSSGRVHCKKNVTGFRKLLFVFFHVHWGHFLKHREHYQNFTYYKMLLISHLVVQGQEPALSLPRLWFDFQKGC